MDAFEKQKRDGVAIDLHRSCELYSPNTGGGGIKRHESRIEIYIPTIDRARRECKVRNEESRFLSSLSLSLSFSTSIAIPPARFLVNQGIFPLPPARMQSHHRCRAASSFLPSFPSKERERRREPPCFVDGISYLSGCCVFGLETDATTSQTLVGFPARVEDWMKRSWREGKGKRRDVCPSSRDFLPSGFVRSFDPRRERHANRLFPSHFPISPNFFFISSRFLRRVKKTSSEIDDPSRFS